MLLYIVILITNSYSRKFSTLRQINFFAIAHEFASENAKTCKKDIKPLYTADEFYRQTNNNNTKKAIIILR